MENIKDIVKALGVRKQEIDTMVESLLNQQTKAQSVRDWATIGRQVAYYSGMSAALNFVIMLFNIKEE